MSAGTADAGGDRPQDALARFRAMGDPLADALAADLRPLGRHGETMFETALRDGIGAVADPPDSLRALFATVDHVPYWVDWRVMNRASAAVLRANIVGAAVLGCYSVPLFYRLGRGAKPLAMTDALVSGAVRRGRRTARFVIETCFPFGLQRDAEGFRLTLRIRLLHARTRLAMLADPGWDAADGVPMAQAYMAAMSAFLSAHWLQGLRRVGVRVPAEDAEAVMQLWRYSSHLMGVHPELLFATEPEAMRFTDRLFASEPPPGPAAQRLMAALFDAVPDVLEQPGWRGRATQRLFQGLAYRLFGPEAAADLGVPRTAWRHAPVVVAPAMAGLGLLQVLAPRLARDARLRGMRLWLQVADYSDVDAAAAAGSW
ncbi:oxygenase MpaB family protein [Stella sp.]|uniref:oxygenase MpaB family protein n=1 Tax=Stella sp. TaxID=2912054 RepID=UPI0035AE9DFA